ncbi:MAG TPA: RidA family protein [Bacillota bacterium]|nr:RidA family protein [Bacillota bacterium]HNY68754.1 RidA family protein [Bacillota bacterium]
MKSAVRTDAAPAAVGPYSQGIRVGNLLFVSGQLPLDPATGTFVEGGIEEQTARCLDNIKAILAQTGISMDSVVKTTVFLADMDDFAAMNKVYSSYFKTDPPARSAFQVARLPKNGQIEIEAIAWVE